MKTHIKNSMTDALLIIFDDETLDETAKAQMIVRLKLQKGVIDVVKHNNSDTLDEVVIEARCNRRWRDRILGLLK